MPKLQVNDRNGKLAAVQVPPNATQEEELDAMLARLMTLDQEMPDVVIRTCMGIMGRLTQIHIDLVRVELHDRKSKFFRTTQLQRVMDLCEFQFKGASRLVEVARQEVDLSR